MKKFSKHLEDKEDLSKLLLMRSSWILVTRWSLLVFLFLGIYGPK
jgi:hypothetical protein